MYILIAILVFGFLIFIHELGHFIAAKACGVKVLEFAIGMGPKLLWFESKKSGTVYALRAFPIGGFVSMLGETEDEAPQGGIADDKLSAPEQVDTSMYLSSKPAWQRLIVNLAGAAMNLIFGFIVMTALALNQNIGTTVIKYPTDESGQVISSSSYESGLRSEDQIIRVGNKRVHIADQLLYAVMSKGHEPVDVEVIRNGEKMVIKDVVFPTFEEQGETFGDVDFKVYAIAKENCSAGQVLKYAFYKSVYVVEMIWDSLFGMVSGRYSLGSVSGPVGVAGAISDAAKIGFDVLLYMVVIISVNLGIFNLLPLPALDGGHVLANVIELIFHKKLPTKVTAIIDMVGLGLLLLLSLIITFKDIIKLF